MATAGTVATMHDEAALSTFLRQLEQALRATSAVMNEVAVMLNNAPIEHKGRRRREIPATISPLFEPTRKLLREVIQEEAIINQIVHVCWDLYCNASPSMSSE